MISTTKFPLVLYQLLSGEERLRGERRGGGGEEERRRAGGRGRGGEGRTGGGKGMREKDTSINKRTV